MVGRSIYVGLLIHGNTHILLRIPQEKNPEVVFAHFKHGKLLYII